MFETFFATWLLGAIAVPVNHRLSAAEIRYMLEDVGTTVLVDSADTDGLVAGFTSAGRAALRARGAPGELPGELPVTTRPRSRAARHWPRTRRSGWTTPLLLYTSGTTGRPKGAVLTHGNLTWNTINYLAHVDVLSTDRALCISPLFHCVGISQVTLPTLVKGGSVEMLAKADPGLVLERVSAGRITSFSAVPTMLQMMCDHPAWDAARRSAFVQLSVVVTVRLSAWTSR